MNEQLSQLIEDLAYSVEAHKDTATFYFFEDKLPEMLIKSSGQYFLYAGDIYQVRLSSNEMIKAKKVY